VKTKIIPIPSTRKNNFYHYRFTSLFITFVLHNDKSFFAVTPHNIDYDCFFQNTVEEHYWR